MGRTFAFADLHGRYDLYQKIEKYVNPEDTLYCLGDCIDRSSDGIKIVDAIKKRDNTIYIKGNHEDMAAAAIPALLHGDTFNKNITLWFLNGGKETWNSIINKDSAKYAQYFASLPIESRYINKKNQLIILTHAGSHPGYIDNFLWDRKHFHFPWPKSPEYQNLFYIHGHTTVQYLEYGIGHDGNWPDDIDMDIIFKKWDPHVIWYANRHKADIDLGSAFTGKTVLLDLDTFEEKYIEV